MADESQRRAHATLYRDRGLSTDSSLRVDFALEQALAAVRDRASSPASPSSASPLSARTRLRGQGAGIRLLSRPDDSAVRARRFAPAPRTAERPAVTALDISPRVLAHLRDARQRAGRGQRYRLNLRARARPPASNSSIRHWWSTGVVSAIASAPERLAMSQPRSPIVRARAVDIRPEAVLDVTGAI